MESEQLFERLLKGRKQPMHNSRVIRQVWKRNLSNVIQREKYDELQKMKEEEIVERKAQIQ
tara:strand:+ start:305 stop:487 length:183 start_codon:yes stop_codon:yes gene_type:complete